MVGVRFWFVSQLYVTCISVDFVERDNSVRILSTRTLSQVTFEPANSLVC